MFRILLILVSILIFLQFYFNNQISIVVCYFYLFINILTFIIYAVDKSAAINQRWRVKELYLHILAFLGGWWGALIAQKFLLHKSIKKKFLVVFSITILLNTILISWISYKGIF